MLSLRRRKHECHQKMYQPVFNNQQHQPVRYLGSTWNGFTQYVVQDGAGKVLRGPLLKQLYEILIKLSPNEILQQVGYDGAISLSNQRVSAKITYTDFIDLSNLLSDALHKRFELLLSGAAYLPSVVVLNENGHLTSDARFSLEEFLILLRCSMIIMQFLAFDLTLALERCQTLVVLLGRICPPNAPLQIPSCSTHHVEAATLEAGISTNFSCAILEVFLDEFSRNHELRNFFIMSACASGAEKKLFPAHSHGDVQLIMELVSSHFLLSVSDESAFDRFIGSLYWSYEVHNQIPALSLLHSAISLLSHRVVFSAPHLLQTHIILLVSRCVGIHVLGNAKKLDVLVMNLYILAFELAVKLYADFIPLLSSFVSIVGDARGSNFGAEGLSFDACIQSMTCDKLRQQIDSLIGICHLPSHDLYCENKAEILGNYIVYLKENLIFIDEKLRDEAFSILAPIVESILLEEREILPEDGGSTQQVIYCVAAVLKLMSSSLLQIVWSMRQNGSSGDMNTTTKTFICKVHEFMSGTISCFGNYGGDRHVQKILFPVTETATGGCLETKMMFLHVASLLSYSFRKKANYLSKGCIFMMISLMNLQTFEEGNLDAFRPMSCEKQGPASTLAKNSEFSCQKASSMAIASNLKKARNQIKYTQPEDCRKFESGEITEMETPNRETNTDEADACSGAIFLKCLPGLHAKNRADWEDLVDFVECDHNKDYSTWLEKREKFRKWRFERALSRKHNVRDFRHQHRSHNNLFGDKSPDCSNRSKRNHME